MNVKPRKGRIGLIITGIVVGAIALAGGWKAKTVKAGGERVKAEAGDRWLVFTFPAGKTAFEAQFEK